ncbi:MAG TPA: sigma-54 dependent transcriptional regulator [Candidatus Aquilonibacter sp.]|nr:sigma-54 dependent transcriptional regulator [Candidatus Aquilonibacter sp.]
MSAAVTAFAAETGTGVLIVSPREVFRKQILRELENTTGEALAVAGGAEALMHLDANSVRTAFLDRQIEDLDVDELAATIQARHPHVRVIVAEREGATGHEFACERLPEAWVNSTKTLLSAAGRPVTPIESLPGMIGSSPRMQRVYRLARLVAPRGTTVLIVGETGTGKELVARGIHELSRRSHGPFIVVNCAAIPESLLEAELFGFTRGAFTGAFQSRVGRIHAAHGGTLLLDEVGELPLGMQAKLLRFVQEGEVQRLGSPDVFKVDTRLMAATNADLMQRMKEKQFREDLYYRLAVFPIELPPLRNRPEDIQPLAQEFLTSLCRQANVKPKMFNVAAAGILRRHSWSGNVRELQHWIERAFVLAEEKPEIEPEDLVMPSEAA